MHSRGRKLRRSSRSPARNAAYLHPAVDVHHALRPISMLAPSTPRMKSDRDDLRIEPLATALKTQVELFETNESVGPVVEDELASRVAGTARRSADSPGAAADLGSASETTAAENYPRRVSRPAAVQIRSLELPKECYAIIAFVQLWTAMPMSQIEANSGARATYEGAWRPSRRYQHREDVSLERYYREARAFTEEYHERAVSRHSFEAARSTSRLSGRPRKTNPKARPSLGSSLIIGHKFERDAPAGWSAARLHHQAGDREYREPACPCSGLMPSDTPSASGRESPGRR